MEQNAAAAKALEEQSLAMDERVTFFRLGDEQPARDAAPPMPAPRRPAVRPAHRQPPAPPPRLAMAGR